MENECIPICRVCMQKSPEFVDFDMPLQNEDEQDTSITYLDFFFECTRIEVEPLEGGSYCFCLPCGDELCSFYKFVKIAEMTDRVFKAKRRQSIVSRRKNAKKNQNSTSPKINELENNTNLCLSFDEVLLCPKKNIATEKIVECIDEDEDATKLPLEDTNDQKIVENSRLISLRVEPYLENDKFCKSSVPISSGTVLKINECMQKTEKKLIKKKSRTGPAECAFCHEIVRNQKLLDRHLVEEHQRRTKPCVLCGKMVIRMRDHLLIHEREKQSIKRPKIECTICFRMISKQTISRHIRHVHQREIRNHKCTECSQTFADAHKLKVHILKGHSSRMNIKCILCARTFSNGISLNNHLRIHPCLERIS